jgi:hypothetical protein
MLQTKYPGKGLQPVKYIFKETISFDEAVRALIEGHRIKRKSERKGYTKVVIDDGKNQKIKYGTYWVSDDDLISDYCHFSIEDVIASDWIIIDS